MAHQLNAEGEPGPRGGEWTPSTINGDRRAQDGILHQELYIGVRVFNRRRYRKHPDTGRRSSVLNPPEDWLREPVPELRIIDDETWQAVQARKAVLADKPAAYARKPRRLLSGLMKCALCGSGMTLNGRKYACSAARERATCRNNKIIAARTVEDRVLAGVRRHLLSPEAIASPVRIFHEERSARRLEALAGRAPAERELSEIDRKLERAQMMFMEEMITMDELEARMVPLKARRTELEVLIATSPSPVVVQLHPGGRGLPPPGGDPAPGDQRRRRRRPAARVAQVDRDRSSCRWKACAGSSCASAASSSACCVTIPRPGTTKPPPFRAGLLRCLTGVRH